MYFRTNDLNRPRRFFVAVFVLLLLMLSWKLSEPWRTDVQIHQIGGLGWIDKIFGYQPNLRLGTNELPWIWYGEEACGFLFADFSSPGWQFAACTRTNLHAVTAQDAHTEFYGGDHEGATAFGEDWMRNAVIIHNTQIILARSRHDTQTVYALQVIEQGPSKGYFRSRKILPAPISH